MVSGNKLVNTHILLVEDEPACSHAITTVLETEQAKVTIAENAEKAVELLKPGGIDVVVTDIKLPGISGIDLLKHIRTISQDLPVIMMTGYGSINSAVEALKLGAQDYLVKPLGEGSHLINSVWNSVEHYRLTIRNKTLQDQLKQSEKTFRMLFHNASDAIFLNELTAGGTMSVFSEANHAACTTLGYSMKELRSMTLIDITAAEHRKSLEMVIKSLTELEHTTFEIVYITRRRKRIPVEINTHTFLFNGKKTMLSIARNIAGRREMEKQIAEAGEKEARRIGQELHDVLCQDLASINMLSSVLVKTLESESSAGIRDAELISKLAINSVGSTRRICAGLFPVEMEEGDLASALEHLAINNEQLYRTPCSFTNRSSTRLADKSVALHLYRIAQQAANNACTHSMARNISITLADNGPGVILTIEDDGTGIISDNNHPHHGMGLHIMKYRANIIGAILTISGRSSGGTKVECSWL